MLAQPGIMEGVYTPTEKEQIECMQGISCNFGICSECYYNISGMKGVVDINEKENSYSDADIYDWV